MKVLHLVHWKKSGIYVAVEALKTEGLNHGDHHDIITLRKDSSLGSSFMSILLFIKFIIQANLFRYDCINLHSFLPYLGNFFCLGAKTTLFFHSNYPFLKSNSIKDKIKLHLTSASNRHKRPVAVSNIVKRSVDPALKTDCAIVYNIIKFHENVSSTRKISRLGTAGRFDPEKRFLELIECFTNLRSDCALHFAGDGHLLGNAISLVNQREQKNVFFHGRQSSMKEFYNLIDAYVCCSKFEGFGLAIAEAMLYGKIIISTKVGILCEDLGFKFLEVNSDLSNLAEIIFFAENIAPDKIQEMVDENRKLLAENFSDFSIYKKFAQQQLEII